METFLAFKCAETAEVESSQKSRATAFSEAENPLYKSRTGAALFDNVKSTLSKAVKSRILILILVLIILAFILIRFPSADHMGYKVHHADQTDQRTGTRGNILDSDGNPLADWLCGQRKL